jgi:Protein of unknown function (DUF3039)
VPDVLTMPAHTKPETEEILQTGEPTVAHIVKTEPGESATAKVLEARIYGTPIEALCGHVWVPSRDPKQVPMCGKCKEIYEVYKSFNDGLNDAPGD